jgi:peptidoglycan/LPS O-acetylase OafA/YrhL
MPRAGSASPEAGREIGLDVLPPEAGREIGLDVLRAVAILSVLAFHALDCIPSTPAWCRAIFQRGWAGVDLFFVLSGFLISRQTFRADARHGSVAGSLRQFWARRWFRTLPLYFVVLFAYAIVKPALFHAPFRGDPLRFAFFLQTYAPLTDFVQSWSLCVEEHFYLVFPLLVFLCRADRLPAVAWLVLPALATIFRVWRWSTLPAYDHVTVVQALTWPTHVHLDGIAIGVFLGRSERAWLAWSSARRRLLGVLGASFVCGYLAWSPAWIAESATHARFGPLLLGGGFACLLVGMRRLPALRAVASPVERMALYSYGAYLWHGLIVRVGTRAFESPNLPWWVAFVAFVFASFAVAALTFHLVERPFLSLRDRLLGVLPAKPRLRAPVPGTTPSLP